MKTFVKITIATVMIAVALNGPLAHAQSLKFGLVDLNRVFEEYYKTPIKRAELETTKNSYQKEMDTMVADLQKRQEELAKLRDDMDRPEYSAEVRDQKRKELQEQLATFKKRDNDLQDYRRTHLRILETRTQDMRMELLKEITEVIKKIAAEGEYTFVLDKSGNSMNLVPVILYARDGFDITEQIITLLNKDKPGKDNK